MSCEAITKKGTDCTNNAIPNTMYCGLHKNYVPDYRCQWTVSTAPTSRDCNEKVANKGDYCSFHQDDAQKLVIVSHMDLIITQIKPINQKTYPLNYDNVSDYTNWEGGVIKGAMMVDLGNKYRTFGIIFENDRVGFGHYGACHLADIVLGKPLNLFKNSIIFPPIVNLNLDNAIIEVYDDEDSWIHYQYKNEDDLRQSFTFYESKLYLIN